MVIKTILMLSVLAVFVFLSSSADSLDLDLSLETQRLLNNSCFMTREGCNQILYHARELRQLSIFHQIEIACSDMDSSCDRLMSGVAFENFRKTHPRD